MLTPRVAAIHDLSGFGRCSLTVAIPILSAMGLQCCPLPTAFLSTHTGGFEGFTFLDMTEEMPRVAAHWKSLDLRFQAIYSGFLGSDRQIDIVETFIRQFCREDTIVVVDPVMGDGGKMYAGFTPDCAREMRKLCAKADVIAPNLTEVSLLLDVPYAETCDMEQIHSYLKQLTELGCRTAVITGVRKGDGHGAAAYDSETGKFYESYRKHTPERMHGTGDIFASVLSGALVRGASIAQALSIAVNFTADTIEVTQADYEDVHREKLPCYSVEFELCIGNLVNYVKEIQ